MKKGQNFRKKSRLAPLGGLQILVRRLHAGRGRCLIKLVIVAAHQRLPLSDSYSRRYQTSVEVVISVEEKCDEIASKFRIFFRLAFARRKPRFARP